MSEITTNDLVKAKLYFGHLKSKWHPRMKPFIFDKKGDIHIFDLKKTLEKLEEALNFVKNLAEKKEKILFIGTKEQAKEIIKKEAEKCKMPYINERWQGGILTNFKIVQSQLKKLKELEEKEAKGFLDRYSKKEKLNFLKKIEKSNKKIGGLKKMEKLPSAVFIIDSKYEKVALDEAKKKKIPIIALVDTDSDPTGIEYIIPGNTRAISSIEFICQKISEAILVTSNK